MGSLLMLLVKMRSYWSRVDLWSSIASVLVRNGRDRGEEHSVDPWSRMAGLLVRNGRQGRRAQGGPLVQDGWCPCKKQERQGRRAPCEDTDTARRWPRDNKPRGRHRFHPEPQTEHGPADTRVSDLCPPELQESRLPLFQAAECAVLCSSSPRK